MRASELPAIGLHARPIRLADRYSLRGRTLGAPAPLPMLEPHRRPSAFEPAAGGWRLPRGKD
jgi:hypothetical protein